MCDDGIDEAQRAGEIAEQRSGSGDVAQGGDGFLDLAEFDADAEAVDQVALGGGRLGHPGTFAQSADPRGEMKRAGDVAGGGVVLGTGVPTRTFGSLKRSASRSVSGSNSGCWYPRSLTGTTIDDSKW